MDASDQWLVRFIYAEIGRLYDRASLADRDRKVTLQAEILAFNRLLTRLLRRADVPA